MPLKSRSSLSSVSIEDSDNQKPGSVGNNPNLRSSGKEYGRGAGDEKPQSRSGMQMSCQAVSGSEAQTLFSSMSTVPLMLQSTKKQRTMTEGTSNHGPDHSLHQHLQVLVMCDVAYLYLRNRQYSGGARISCLRSWRSETIWLTWSGC